MTENGLEDVVRPASFAENPDALRRVLVGRRMRGVRKALVVEVVDETGQSPALGILAVLLGIGAHRGFHGQHVFAERFARGVFVHQSERVSPRRQDLGRGHVTNISR